MSTPPIADLELALRVLPDGRYEADLTLTHPASAAGFDLAIGRPVAFDLPALTAAGGDPDAYGRLLTAQLFADPALRDAWQRARTMPEASGLPLRLRLNLDPRAEALHRLLWETLREPGADRRVATSERVRLSRYLGTAAATLLAIVPPVAPQVVVAVANPTNLATFGLAPVDVAGEVARMRDALSPLTPIVLAAGEPGRPTLEQIRTALRAGAHVLYLACHGTIVEQEPYLWLEASDGSAERVSATDLVDAIAELGSRPRLIILAACRSGGDGHVVRAALAPRLVSAGVPAVIGAQGDLPMEQIAVAMPTLMRELRQDGQIDRALAAARATLRQHPDWWRLALWMHLRDGQIWPPPAAGPALAPPAPPSPEAAFRCHQIRLSFLWAETLPIGARRGRRAPALDLGTASAYGAAYDSIPRGDVRTLDDGTALRHAWPKLRGEHFWESYLERYKLRGITGQQAYKHLVPLHVRLPWQAGLLGLDGTVAIDGYGFPHGAACAITVRHDGDLDGEQLITLAMMVRRARVFTLDPAPADFDGTLDSLAEATLARLAVLTTGAADGGRQAVAQEPWSQATIISGSGAAPALPIAEGGPTHRLLEALTLWKAPVAGEVPTALARARVTTGTAKIQAGDLLYGHTRARALWLPRAFLQTQPIAALGCYHRNLIAAALQVESLGGLIRQAAERLEAGQALDGPLRSLAQRASDALGRLYTGEHTTYRTRSAQRQISDNDLLDPLGAVRRALGHKPLPPPDMGE